MKIGQRFQISFLLYAVNEYLFPRGVYQLGLAIKRKLSGGWRTTSVSVQINDTASQQLRKQIENMETEQLYDRVVHQKGIHRHVLQEDRVIYGDSSNVEQFLHEELARALRLAPKDNRKVLEVGCSCGRNLFWLKKHYPGLILQGADISGDAIQLGKSLAQRLSYEVQFVQLTDHRLPFPDGHFDLAFTKHCMEQCPYTYKPMIDELIRVTRERIVFLEPMEQLQPVSVRGLFNRLHGFYHNYSRGVYGHLRRKAQVVEARPLAWASNPFNQTCLVAVKP